MADKQVKVRIAMDGGKAVEAQLQGIGKAGKASLDGIGQASGQMRGNIQNASYQVQDFFVQVASGTDPTRALAQQLPQLLGSLGLFGVLAGTAAAALIPLGAAIFGAGEDAVDTTERVENLAKALSDLKQATSAANADQLDMFAQYGMGAEQAREILEIERQIAQVRAERALGDAGRALGSGAVDMGPDSRDMGEALAAARTEYALLSAEIEAFGQIQSEADQQAWDALQMRRAALDEVFRSTQNYRNAMIDFADGLGLVFEGNEVALQNINNAMLDLAAADTIEGQASAAAALRTALFEASDGGRLLNEEGAKLLDGLTDAELAALALSQVDIASGISNASAEAVALAQNMGIALGIAQSLAALGPQGINTNPDPSGEVYSGRGGDPRAMGGEALDWQTRDAYDFLRDWKPAKAGGGKGGGGVSEEQKAQNDLMREAQRLYEQTRTDAEKYTAEVANLDQMLKAGLIDQDLYNRGLARASEQYGAASGAAAFFKDMNIDIKESLIDVALEGGSALDGLIEKLKRAAIEAALFGSGPIADLLGMTGGGLLGDLLGGPVAGAKAAGGPVEMGKAYRVGETGPELFVPNASGTILPIDPMSEVRLPQMGSGSGASRSSGGGTVEIIIRQEPGVVAEIARNEAGAVFRLGISQYDTQALPARVAQIRSDPRRRG